MGKQRPRQTDQHITADELRRIAHYDAESGVMAWAMPRKSVPVGRVMGCLDGAGYLCVRINYRLYRVHRLIWIYVHGDIDEKAQIDHANMCRADNRLSNLRLATNTNNSQNKKAYSNNKLGLKGVSKHTQNNSYQAEIQVDGRKIKLGSFTTPEAARAAYVDASKEHFGQFTPYL